MWLVSDIHELAAIKEMEQASDRALGIITGAIIDSKLSDVLKRALGDGSPYARKVLGELFHPDGPLGSFGHRISMAYLIGLLTESGHGELRALKQIRNLFAHYKEHNAFDSQSVRAHCEKFKLIDDRVFEQVTLVRDADSDSPSKVTIDAVVIEDRKLCMALNKDGDDFTSPRWRFVTSAKLFCATLDVYLQSPQDLDVPLL